MLVFGDLQVLNGAVLRQSVEQILWLITVKSKIFHFNPTVCRTNFGIVVFNDTNVRRTSFQKGAWFLSVILEYFPGACVSNANQVINRLSLCSHLAV